MSDISRKNPYNSNELFPRFDLSTQSITVIAVNGKHQPVYEASVQFDKCMPEFKTSGGVIRHEDKLTVTAPPLMWVGGLDLLLEQMAKDRFPFKQVIAVSGSGQQHGSVFLKDGASSVLAGLSPEKTLRDQVSGIFAFDRSPVWMDSSTTRQCLARDSALGGAQSVAELT